MTTHVCRSCTGSLIDILGDPSAPTVLSSLSAFRAHVETKGYCVFSLIGKQRRSQTEPVVRRLLDGRTLHQDTFSDPCMQAYIFCRESINMHTRTTVSVPRMKAAYVSFLFFCFSESMPFLLC